MFLGQNQSIQIEVFPALIPESLDQNVTMSVFLKDDFDHKREYKVEFTIFGTEFLTKKVSQGNSVEASSDLSEHE